MLACTHCRLCRGADIAVGAVAPAGTVAFSHPCGLHWYGVSVATGIAPAPAQSTTVATTASQRPRWEPNMLQLRRVVHNAEMLGESLGELPRPRQGLRLY